MTITQYSWLNKAQAFQCQHCNAKFNATFGEYYAKDSKIDPTDTEPVKTQRLMYADCPCCHKETMVAAVLSGYPQTDLITSLNQVK